MKKIETVTKLVYDDTLYDTASELANELATNAIDEFGHGTLDNVFRDLDILIEELTEIKAECKKFL